MHTRHRRHAPIWIAFALVALGIAWFASMPVDGDRGTHTALDLKATTESEASTEDLTAPRVTTERELATDIEVTNEELTASDSSESEGERVDAIPSQYALRVHLLDEFGAPIADRATSLYLIGEGGVHRSSDRGDKGVHEFRRLVAGTWRIAGSALGYEPASDEVQLDSTTKGLERSLVLVARDCVRIRLESRSGQPVKSAPGTGFDAIASRERRSGPLRETSESGALLCGYTTSRDRVGLDESYLGMLVLDCERPVWVHLVLGSTILEAQRLDRGVDELKFVVADGAPESMLANLRVRAVDSVRGEPILNSLGYLRVGPRMKFASVGSAKGMIYAGVMPGIVQLDLRARGYESRKLEIELRPGEKRDLGDLVLSAALDSELRVVWKSKDPIPNALVSWGDIADRWPGGALGSSMNEECARDAQTHTPVTAGTWHVWATANYEDHEYAARPVVASVDGGVVDVALQLERVARLVLLPTRGRCTVTILDPLLTGGVSTRATARTFEVDVTGTVQELPVGAWDVEITPKDGATRTQRIELGVAGLTLRIDG